MGRNRMGKTGLTAVLAAVMVFCSAGYVPAAEDRTGPVEVVAGQGDAVSYETGDITVKEGPDLRQERTYYQRGI